MKINPWGAAVIAVLLVATLETLRPRISWLLVPLLFLLLIGYACADVQYCVVEDHGKRVAIRCNQGNVTVVDNLGDRVIACFPSEKPKCQTVALKEKK